MPRASNIAELKWQYRIAVLLACVTFPLIWVGGLVTTYEAGMAVPDWPTTYGYNLLLYPYETWLLGPWDLFIEHGHRLLGALAGVLTIAFVVLTLSADDRKWMRVLSVIGLAVIIFQGSLGGLRVLLDERVLAMLHGCLAPAFFGLAVCLAMFTCPSWRSAKPPTPQRGARRVHQAGLLVAVLVFAQLILGAQLRHIPFDASPGAFRAVVFAHLGLAGLITALVAMVAWSVFRLGGDGASLRRPSIALTVLFLLQLCLGGGAYVVTYYWPDWSQGFRIVDSYAITAAGMLESMIVTAHAATGSLVLGFALVVLARSLQSLTSNENTANENTANEDSSLGPDRLAASVAS